MTRFAPIALTGIAIVGVLIAAVTLAVISDGDGPPDDVADVPDERGPSPTPTATPTPAPGGGGGTGGGTEDTQAPESAPESGLDGTAGSDEDGTSPGTEPDDDRASPDVDVGSDADRDLGDRARGPRSGDVGPDRDIAGRQPRAGALPNTGGVPGPLALAALAGGITLGGVRLVARRASH